MVDVPRYHPGPAPAMGGLPEVWRYLDDEFHVLSENLRAEHDRFAYFAVGEADTIALTNVPTWEQMLLDAVPALSAGVTWDSPTGTATVLEKGIYQIGSSLEIDVIGGTGNRDIAVGTRIVAAGNPSQDSVSSGSDEFPLKVDKTIMIPMAAGDTVTWWGTAYTSNPAGSVANIQSTGSIFLLR